MCVCVLARWYHLPSGWHYFNGGQDAQLTKSVLNGTDTSCANCIRKSGKLHKSNSSVNDRRSFEGPRTLYIQVFHPKYKNRVHFLHTFFRHQDNLGELFIAIVTQDTACHPRVSRLWTVYHEMNIYLMKWNLVVFNRIFTSHFWCCASFGVGMCCGLHNLFDSNERDTCPSIALQRKNIFRTWKL